MSNRREDILDAVSRATNKLILDEPFYGHYFVGLVKEVHDKVQTMAVGPSGSQIKLHINPEFWNKRLTSEPLRVGLLKHEILHIVLKHIFRGKDHKHKDLFNIACDLVVNQYILESSLPPDRLHLGLFPELKLLPEMDANYYYNKLLPPFEQLQRREEAESGSGDPTENTLRDLLGDPGDWISRHSGWEEIERLPTALQEVLEQNVTEAVQQALEKARHDKRWGNLPAGLRRGLEEAAKRSDPAVNWRRVLRMFAESSSKTFVQNTIRRPSKRFGTTPGIRLRRKQNLLVALDTSGSISQEELALFVSELYHLWKRGAQITVVEADMQIQSVYPFQGRLNESVKGGGGTDFSPVIRLANSMSKLDAIVYFTDGEAPAPEVKLRFPILWMITKEGIPKDSERWKELPGRKVKIMG